MNEKSSTGPKLCLKVGSGRLVAFKAASYDSLKILDFADLFEKIVQVLSKNDTLKNQDATQWELIVSNTDCPGDGKVLEGLKTFQEVVDGIKGVSGAIYLFLNKIQTLEQSTIPGILLNILISKPWIYACCIHLSIYASF